MVGFQPIFDGCNPTSPRIGILITLRHLVLGIWSIWKLTNNLMNQETRSYMHTCDCFLIRPQTPNGDSYRNEWGTDHQRTDQLGVYVSSLATLGKIYHNGIRHTKLVIPGSMGIQFTTRCDATAWTMYMFIYPILNILRILEVWKGTRGRTKNWYLNTMFDPLAMRGPTSILILAIWINEIKSSALRQP